MTQRELTEPTPLSSPAGSVRDNLHSPGLTMGWAGRWSKSRPASPPPRDPHLERSSRGQQEGKQAQPGMRHAILSRNPPSPPHAQILPSFERITSRYTLQSKSSPRQTFTNAPNPCPILPWGTAQLPKRPQVSQGIIVHSLKPPASHHTGGSLTNVEWTPRVPRASAARKTPPIIYYSSSNLRRQRCGATLILAGVREGTSTPSRQQLLTATMRCH